MEKTEMFQNKILDVKSVNGNFGGIAEIVQTSDQLTKIRDLNILNTDNTVL
jgi:hypothetical protein